MENGSARPVDSAERLVSAYADALYRLCLLRLSSPADAEDAVQETFLRYLNKKPVFESDEHAKAWLLKVALNVCRDVGRARSRHPTVDLSELELAAPEPEDGRILEALMKLPDKYRVVLTLYYAEGYSTAEIAGIVGKTASAVKMRLKKGRELLKNQYEQEEQS